MGHYLRGRRIEYLLALRNTPDSEELTSEEKEGYREQFLHGEQCKHCGGLHLRACRRVRRLVMRNREEIGEVEFWQDGKWDESEIIWPEDIFDGTGEGEGEDEAAASEAAEAGS